MFVLPPSDTRLSGVACSTIQSYTLVDSGDVNATVIWHLVVAVSLPPPCGEVPYVCLQHYQHMQLLAADVEVLWIKLSKVE